MVRLKTTRKGKTPVDVTVTEQNELKRVRLSMGEREDGNRFRNTDLNEQEVRDLITLLEWNLAKVQGRVPWDA